MAETNIQKINENEWQIEKTGMMNVPVVIFASEKLLEKMKEDETFKQAKNVACLLGIFKKSIVLPDAHIGYGFSIGGVAAFDIDKGVISPGGVGYDINFGVRIISTNLKKEDVEKKKKELINQIFR